MADCSDTVMNHFGISKLRGVCGGAVGAVAFHKKDSFP